MDVWLEMRERVNGRMVTELVFKRTTGAVTDLESNQHCLRRSKQYKKAYPTRTGVGSESYDERHIQPCRFL